MASVGRAMGRSFLSTTSSFCQTRRPALHFFRLPGEMAVLQSLLPLHSANASSRLVAQLSTTAGAFFQDFQSTLSRLSRPWLQCPCSWPFLVKTSIFVKIRIQSMKKKCSGFHAANLENLINSISKDGEEKKKSSN
uniref:Uncharacterized protein n=1 Tax=Physcomitrium patens TaxID=3218 RepID=A0A7I4BZ28_PHYPA